MAHRQSVEKLIGDDKTWPLGHVIERCVPAHRRLCLCESFLLRIPQYGARLDQMHFNRCAKTIRDACRAQSIAHQCAATGAQLNEIDTRGLAEHRPDLSRPKPDQFAEHLGDFRRCDEIPRTAERIARHIIAVTRMAERYRHKSVERHRPVMPDRLPYHAAKLVHAPVPRRP